MLAPAVVILTAIVNIIIALIVLTRNSRSSTHRLIAALAIVTAGWSILNYLPFVSPSPESKLFWVRATMFFTAPYGAIVMLLALTFPGQTLGLKNPLRTILYIYLAVTAAAAFSPFMFTNIVVKPDGSFSPVPGPAILLYAIGFIGLLAAGFIILIHKYITTTGVLKKQVQIILVGLIVSFTLLAVTNFVAVVVFRSTDLVLLGPPCTLFLVACIVYAILKHRFLDINFIVARAVSYTILTAIATVLYAESVITVGSLYANKTNAIVIETALMLVFALSLNWFRHILERTTDRILYKGRYDPDEVLLTATQTMAETMELSSLALRVLSILKNRMRLSTVSVMIPDRGSCKAYSIPDPGPFTSITMETLERLAREKSQILITDLEEGEIKTLMRNNNISIFVPLFTQQNIVGYFLAGDKASGDMYVEQDLKTFSIVAPEFAIALDNALHYEEIARFNVTLKEEVTRATGELKEANVRLTELDKLKDEFLSVASHDLRTPMTAIKGYLWLMLKHKEELSPQTQDRLMRIYISADRMIALINDMLDISRIEAGRIELVPETLNISDEIRDVVEELSSQASDKKQTLTFNSHGPLYVRADRNKLHEILVNLIGNAIKYTPENGIITVEYGEALSMASISITDTGIGIKNEDLSKLFTKFTRLATDHPSIPNVTGTGLGLYICKKLVELSGGVIGVSTEYGKGSTFRFTLPHASQSPTPPSAG